MNAEQQYIDLFSQTEAMICQHSTEVMNTPRATAFADFERLGFPTRKQEKCKYTDVSKFFEPDYGLNLNRLDIPVNPYEVFKCDVPNMSTSLYFAVKISEETGLPLVFTAYRKGIDINISPKTEVELFVKPLWDK